MAKTPPNNMPGEKRITAAVSLASSVGENLNMITFMGKFGAALVASLVGLFVISTFVNLIYGTPSVMTAQAPASQAEKQMAATTPAPATKPAEKTAPAPKTEPAATMPAKPAAAATPAPAKPAAAAPVSLKQHPGRKAYLRKGACAACHGRKGQRAISYYPAVAGQDKKYMIQQIKDIMSGKRRGGIDTETGHPRAKAMHGALISAKGEPRITGEDIRQMADWLTKLPPAKPKTPETPPTAESVAMGKKLFKRCIACHGKEGKKPLKGYPFIAGQKRIYLLQQMTDIRDKTRTNGKTKVMLAFVKKLDDGQLASIADYLAQIDRTAK